MAKRSIKELLVLATVQVIDIIIKFVRLIRYGLLLPLTPILAVTIPPCCNYLLDVKFGKDIIVKDWRFYAKMLAYGELGVVEMYVDGWWESEDIEALTVKAGSKKWIKKTHQYSCFRLERFLRWGLFNLQTRKGALASAKLQYNLGVKELFGQFLGETAVYSMAYFPTGKETLEEAQMAKCRLIAEKLRLSPGMSVLDVGCGYGVIAKYLASNFGVKVVGITNASTMAEEGKKLCEGHDVSILCCDWRDATGLYDRIVCVEMHEHVGWHSYGRFWDKMRSLLKADGLLVLQTFLCTMPGGHDSEYLANYMYGQLYAPFFHEILKYSGKHFVLGDYQNMSSSAVRTCREWTRRLKEHKVEISAKVGIEAYRGLEMGYSGLPGTLRTWATNHGQFVFFPKEKTDEICAYARVDLSEVIVA